MRLRQGTKMRVDLQSRQRAEVVGPSRSDSATIVVSVISASDGRWKPSEANDVSDPPPQQQDSGIPQTTGSTALSASPVPAHPAAC